jgi:hypothetical protein
VTRLATIAAVSSAAAVTFAAGSYSLLYSRFDRVMMRPAATPASSRRRSKLRIERSRTGASGAAAIRGFTRLTLVRSPMHQGVFVAIAACGVGLVLNSFIGLKAIPRLHRTYADELAAALTWAPFALMFVTTLAVRAALVLPVEPRANWVFRMTEHGDARVQQLGAVVGAMIRIGVIAPVVALFPFQWTAFGRGAITGTAIAFLAGALLVEIEMREWRRIPFTCSYMPGKRFVGLTALIGFAGFVVFASIGSLFVYVSRTQPIAALMLMAVLSAVVWQQRRRRMRLTRHTPLIFEDALPSEVEPLRLTAY